MSTRDDDNADPHSKTMVADFVVPAAAVPAASVAVASRATSPEDGPQLIGGRYELLGMLGAGAMGTVYRARDRELDEVVALKVLKKELASPDMIERFRREVKLARRVTHKNVARTYDIGEHGGDRFLTMEFIEGEMLGALLSRKGRLPIAEVTRLGIDVCAGLSAAHAANVLHRDLKPENVIVAKDGRAVITDFGIARAVTEGELTRTQGGIVGTPAYMAPEQVEGSNDLDARTDLYALGAMLFELLTGQMAWTGESVVTVAAARLLHPPPDARIYLPTLPATVAEVLLKLMARHRENRYASADEVAYVLFDLTGLTHASQPSLPRMTPQHSQPQISSPTTTGTGTVAMPRPAPSSGTLPLTQGMKPRGVGARVVAVLPVLNLGNKDDDYLVDSVNEDVIDLLSVVPNLLVRPRGETRNYVDPKRDVREAGRALGVDVVVDASLRRIGENVRASFRLIAVEDGFQLWARRFDRPPAQVLSIADDAAHAIALALTTELTTAPKQPRAADAETEDLFLRGRFLMRRGWQGSSREAVDMLARAYERAPDDARIIGHYALALARVYGVESSGGDGADRARALALRATELDPNLAEAKVAIAIVHLMLGEGRSAVGYLHEAVKIAPNCIDALDWFGRIAGEVDRVDEAVQFFKRVIAIEPDGVAVRYQMARVVSMMGDREGAMKLLGSMPTHPSDIAAWFLTQSRTALWYRDVDQARRLLELLPKVEVPPSARFPIQSILNITMGNGTLLVDPALLDRLLPIDGSRPPRRASFNAQMRAELCLSVGENDRAIEMIGGSDGNGLMDVVWITNCPLLAPIRTNPQFLVLRERVTLRAHRVAEAIDARA